MITITATVDADGALSPYETCVDMAVAAQRLGLAITAPINGVLVTARPGVEPDEVWQRYKVDKAKLGSGGTP
jgi:hypothetical protein